MKVTFLGTGTSSGVPLIACKCHVCISSDWRDKRLRCSILIEAQGKTILVDTSADFRQQMLLEDVQRLDAVLFTHGHKDHTGGLDDIKAFNFSTGKDMMVYANAYTEQMLRQQNGYIFAEKKYPGVANVIINPIDKVPFTVEGIEIMPIEVMHHKLPVTAYRIKDFTYITDAKTVSESEKEKIKGTKILVVNALRFEPHMAHFNLEEALKFVEEIQPEKTYFTHISHRFARHIEIEKLLPKNVKVAYDGLVLNPAS